MPARLMSLFISRKQLCLITVISVRFYFYLSTETVVSKTRSLSTHSMTNCSASSKTCASSWSSYYFAWRSDALRTTPLNEHKSGQSRTCGRKRIALEFSLVVVKKLDLQLKNSRGCTQSKVQSSMFQAGLRSQVNRVDLRCYNLKVFKSRKRKVVTHSIQSK